jgi:hypothetical protein
MDMTQTISRVRTARASAEQARLAKGVPEYSYSGDLVFISHVVTAAQDTAGEVTLPTEFSLIYGRPIVQVISGSTNPNDQKTGIEVVVNGSSIVLRDGASTTLVAGDFISIIARGSK